MIYKPLQKEKQLPVTGYRLQSDEQARGHHHWKIYRVIGLSDWHNTIENHRDANSVSNTTLR